MTFSSLFCARLKEERKRLGLSQAEAAVECGVSREVWGRYERAAAIPGGEVLSGFAALGADVQYVLVGRRGTQPDSSGLPPDEQLLLDSYRALGAAKKKQLLAELLTGAPAKKTGKAGGVTVTGNGNRTAGGTYHER